MCEIQPRQQLDSLTILVHPGFALDHDEPEDRYSPDMNDSLFQSYINAVHPCGRDATVVIPFTPFNVTTNDPFGKTLSSLNRSLLTNGAIFYEGTEFPWNDPTQFHTQLTALLRARGYILHSGTQIHLGGEALGACVLDAGLALSPFFDNLPKLEFSITRYSKDSETKTRTEEEFRSALLRLTTYAIEHSDLTGICSHHDGVDRTQPLTCIDGSSFTSKARLRIQRGVPAFWNDFLLAESDRKFS
jgi:hypothetical protein